MHTSKKERKPSGFRSFHITTFTQSIQVFNSLSIPLMPHQVLNYQSMLCGRTVIRCPGKCVLTEKDCAVQSIMFYS